MIVNRKHHMIGAGLCIIFWRPVWLSLHYLVYAIMHSSTVNTRVSSKLSLCVTALEAPPFASWSLCNVPDNIIVNMVSWMLYQCLQNLNCYDASWWCSHIWKCYITFSDEYFYTKHYLGKWCMVSHVYSREKYLGRSLLPHWYAKNVWVHWCTCKK